jgi:hypothetical protein
MAWRPGLLYAGVLVLLASCFGVLLAVDWGMRWLAMLSAFGMAVSGVLFLLSIFLPKRGVDWDRVRTEQRLWESGPLGKAWLRTRQRLFRLWKW